MIDVLLIATLLAAPAEARGRVVRVVGTDTVAAAGATVMLHRVGPDTQGVIDSAVAGRDGRFVIRYVRDTAAFLLSARWRGIEYFAPPLDGSAADRDVVIVVADTGAAVPVQVSARHVVVSGPAPDGTRTVVDLVILDNATRLTRVGGGEEGASWRMIVPPHVANLRVADSDFAPTAFDRHGDTLELLAPIPPGERQLFIEYQVPPRARSLVIPIDPAVSTLTVMTEDAARVTRLQALTDTVVNGRAFHRWRGGAVAGRLTIDLAGRGVPSWFARAVAGLVALVLVAAAVLVIRRAPRGTRVPDDGDLVTRIAELDARYRGGVHAHDATAWAAYLAERARLKAELARQLDG